MLCTVYCTLYITLYSTHFQSGRPSWPNHSVTQSHFPSCFYYIVAEYYAAQFNVHSHENCTVQQTLHGCVCCTVHCTERFTLQKRQRGWFFLEFASTLPPLHCTVHSTVLPVQYTKMYTKMYTMLCTVLSNVLHTVSVMRLRLTFWSQWS